ncbi:MAG TPA: M48 family metalloprotease [Candidatus Limnocylindrales bacterium]
MAEPVATAPIRLRPNVLAHPSPTTGRFLLLVAAMLSTGLLAGTLVHNGVLGSRWSEAARACFALADEISPILDPGDTLAQIAHNDVLSSCLAPAERVRAWFDIAGAVLIGLLGLLVLLAAPAYVRRRQKLREAGSRLDGAVGRIGELAAEVGLGRPPRLLLGRAGQRDAFVFGLPGRYYLVLPTALVVRWRSGAYFDPVVRHELAHLKRHDVPLAWLAGAVWVAALPVIVLPLITSMVRLDFSLIAAYLWRIALFMVVIWLIRRQALRSREHDADLHAARQSGDWRPLCSVLQTATTAQPGGWWRRFVSNHPTVAQRVAVLTDPGKVRGVSVVDGLAGGFLTAVLVPALSGTLQVLLAKTPAYSFTPHIVALLVGPIAGLAVGVGLWRQAMIDQVTGERVWPGGAVLGFVAGLLIGYWADLDDLALGGDWSYSIPVLIVAGAGAVLLSAGTGRLWADAAARLPGGPRSWWLGFVVNALIFAMALWLAQWLPVVFTAAGVGQFGLDDLAISSGELISNMVYVPLLPVVVAAATMVRRRRTLPLPAWLLEGGPTAWPLSAREPGLGMALLGGVAAGVIAALGTTGFRLAAGSPVDDADRIGRYLLWLMTITFVALAVSFVTMVVVPRSGGAVGLVTGLPAALVGSYGTTALNSFAFGNIIDLGFWWTMATSVVALWFFGYLLLLPVSLAVWPASWRDVPGWLLAMLNVIVAGLVALCVVGLAIALR